MRRAFAVSASALLLACETAPREPSPEARDAAVAEIAGEEITLAELDAYVKEELFANRTRDRNPSRLYEVRRAALKRLLEARVVERAAAERGLSPDALLEQEVAARGPIDEEDVEAFYEQNRERIGDTPLEEVEPAIRSVLGEERRAAVIAELREQAEVSVYLEAPRVDVAAEGPSLGPADAPVTIIEFSDFQCPYCRRARSVVRELSATYPDSVRIVYRHLPLDRLHPRARAAAEASACADEQGQFWEYHDLVFDNGQRLADDDLLQYARSLELDEERFAACVESHRYADKVQRDSDAARAVGISGTPAFVVNGIILNGVQPMSRFAELIEAELRQLEEADVGLTGESEVGTL